MIPRPKLYMASALALCALALLAVPSAYYAQTQGVCLTSMRVLSEQELRQAVLMNLINSTVEGTFARNQELDFDHLWVGINSPAQETDLRKLIDASFNSGKSFEENFGLKVLLRGREKEKLAFNEAVEPFLLMVYEPNLEEGLATFFSSPDIQEIPFANLTAENKAAAKRHPVYERLLGYGNHYFRIPSSSLERACCDNRDKEREEYLTKKREAYERSILTFPELEQLKEDNPFIAVVSNCGNIMLDEDGSIHLLGREFTGQGP